MRPEEEEEEMRSEFTADGREKESEKWGGQIEDRERTTGQTERRNEETIIEKRGTSESVRGGREREGRRQGS